MHVKNCSYIWSFWSKIWGVWDWLGVGFKRLPLSFSSFLAKNFDRFWLNLSLHWGVLAKFDQNFWSKFDRKLIKFLVKILAKFGRCIRSFSSFLVKNWPSQNLTQIWPKCQILPFLEGFWLKMSIKFNRPKLVIKFDQNLIKNQIWPIRSKSDQNFGQKSLKYPLFSQTPLYKLLWPVWPLLVSRGADFLLIERDVVFNPPFRRDFQKAHLSLSLSRATPRIEQGIGRDSF